MRFLLAWAARGVMKAAGGTVSTGLVHVLGRWSDLTALAKVRVATIALRGDWRAGAVRDAEAVAFYEGHVDFSAVSLELELSLAQLGFLARDGSPRRAPRCCAGRCTWPPTPLASAIPPWPSCTAG